MHRNGKVVRVTALVVIGDTEACLHHQGSHHDGRAVSVYIYVCIYVYLWYVIIYLVIINIIIYIIMNTGVGVW